MTRSREDVASAHTSKLRTLYGQNLGSRTSCPRLAFHSSTLSIPGRNLCCPMGSKAIFILPTAALMFVMLLDCVMIPS